MTTLCKKRICLAASNIFDKWLGKDFKRERKGKTDTLPEVKGTPVNFSSKLKWKKLTVEPQRYIIQKVLSPTTTDLWCRPQRMGVWLTWCLCVEETETHFVVDSCKVWKQCICVAGMLKTVVLLQQTQFTAFLLQVLRKSQHMQHKTKFWIKSADEDKPQVEPAWYNVMFGRPRTFSLIAWYFSFSLAWHHLNFRTAIVRGADIKWALHHWPNAHFFLGKFLPESSWIWMKQPKYLQKRIINENSQENTKSPQNQNVLQNQQF